MSGGVEIGVEADRKRASRQWHKYVGRGSATILVGSPQTVAIFSVITRKKRSDSRGIQQFVPRKP